MIGESSAPETKSVIQEKIDDYENQVNRLSTINEQLETFVSKIRESEIEEVGKTEKGAEPPNDLVNRLDSLNDQCAHLINEIESKMEKMHNLI